MKQDATRNAAYTVDCEDYVHVVEFNPFESGDSGNLIAYGGNNYVVIGMCNFQVSVQNYRESQWHYFTDKKGYTNFSKIFQNFENMLSLNVKKKKTDMKNYRERHSQ